MTNPNERLSQMLRDEADRMKSASANANPMKVLGGFINAILINLGRSRADFAKQMNMELVLVDGILDGILPASELDDLTLVELARAVNYEPNILRAMIGRSVQTSGQVAGESS